MPRGCLRFVIVVFPDHTHLLFLKHLRSLITPPLETQILYMKGAELASFAIISLIMRVALY